MLEKDPEPLDTTDPSTNKSFDPYIFPATNMLENDPELLHTTDPSTTKSFEP